MRGLAVKWKVKVGEEFDLDVIKEDEKSASLKDWKSLAVLATFTTVMVFFTYAAVTRDFTPVYKVLDALVSVAKASAEAIGKDNAAKSECEGKND